MKFPENFLWGSATSAYQIEGAVSQDGRGPSIWDTFSHTPGKVFNGETGDIAIDHYNRMPADVAIMKEMGLQAYRFSISWSRIMPEGRGRVEKKGLDFYNRLADELIRNEIKPLPTLYHWDMPEALDQEGGWLNRDSAKWFADYSAIVYESLADRVDTWATLNEPWCSSFLGYAAGIHAPGHQNASEAFTAAHHLLLAHGTAVEAMRAIDATTKLGIVLNLAPVYLEEEAPVGHPAHQAIALQDAMLNRLWLDTIFKAQYPKTLTDLGSVFTESIQDGDLAQISRPLDWLGVNYYQDSRSVLDDSGTIDGYIDSTGNGTMPGSQGVKAAGPVGEITDFGWSTTPDGLRVLLESLDSEYPNLPPILITENGCAYDDPMVDGVIDDKRRIAYMTDHLRAVAAAIAAGVDVRGYMHWSLFDNFEWAEGYSKRFGMIHVDFETQKRTLRQSAKLYSQIIKNNGLV